MKKLNTLKRISCLMILIVLFFGKSSFAQQKTLVLDAHRFNPVGLAHYNVIVAKQFIDRNDNAYLGDPSGQSVMNSLTIAQGINIGGAITSLIGGSTVDFGSGDASLANISAHRFSLDSGGPVHGDFVYDIAEAITVEVGDVCDVVVISHDKDLTVTRSTIKFDVKVAGVISESPKISMGSIDTGYKPLALAGIVRCNVNTQNGPIKKGDILVTSSEPGYAMRADEGQILPGMIVGRALDAFEQGKGKIYILIN